MTRRIYPPTESESDIPMHGGGPYSDVHRERIRAHEKFKDHPKGSQETVDWKHESWTRVVLEELGEAAQVRNDFELGVLLEGEARNALRKELVQVAAMTVAWIDAIDQEQDEEQA